MSKINGNFADKILLNLRKIKLKVKFWFRINLEIELINSILNQDMLAFNILINMNLNLNSKTISGKTALHYAVNMINLEVVEKLIEAGIDVSIKDNGGVDAVTLAEVKFHDFRLEKKDGMIIIPPEFGKIAMIRSMLLSERGRVCTKV